VPRGPVGGLQNALPPYGLASERGVAVRVSAARGSKQASVGSAAG
jgi:hypothetical protein